MSNDMHVDRDKVSKLENDFIGLIESRARTGAEEYGEFTFMKNNTFDMMIEELADIVNYCRFTYIKLRIFQEEVQNALSEHRSDLDVAGD